MQESDKIPSAGRILRGVRIISFTTGYAGPFAGRLLAQFGADVIKIESFHGGLDSFRHFAKGEDVDAAPRFIECNLGVRSLTVNLKTPGGVQLIKELAAKSDAVLENFRPRVLERLGLGEKELREVNPGIIILKMPGMGQKGPKSKYGTWGFNLNSFCGMTHLWNHPGQPRPIGSQGVYPDHVGFIMAPTLMVAALLRRRLTGEGVSIDMAQVEAAAYMLGVSYLEAAVNRSGPEPAGNLDPTASPHGCYPCEGKDRWCVLSVRTDGEWRSFCLVMGRGDLADDPRFRSRQARCQNREEIDKIAAEWTGSRAAEEVMKKLQEARIAAGVVQNGNDLVNDPQLRHRNYFARFASSPVGSFEIPRGALLFDGMLDEPLSLPGSLGEHTDEILRDLLGYDDKTIAEWRAEGVLS
jgi:benzylsuccinate CoA-transferase BbsF subunit